MCMSHLSLTKLKDGHGLTVIFFKVSNSHKHYLQWIFIISFEQTEEEEDTEEEDSDDDEEEEASEEESEEDEGEMRWESNAFVEKTLTL